MPGVMTTKEKKYVLPFLVFIFLQTSFLSADNLTPKNIQEIYRQWTAIESKLHDSRECRIALIETIDSFYSGVLAFFNSEIYRVYSLIPSTSPNTYMEIIELTGDLRKILRDGEYDRTHQLSYDINRAFIGLLIWDRELDRFSGAANFRLLVVFFIFIILMAYTVLVLNKALTRSLGREAENSIFSQAVFLAQEEERERLSRELHDTIAQDLSWLSLGMEKISRTENQSERERLCSEAAQAQLNLIRRARTICNYLVPPDFRSQGLFDAIRLLCMDLKKRSGIDCRAEIMEGANVDFLKQEMKLQVFRIVQEALNNIEKHSGASEAIVGLRSDREGNIYIGISDDGKGITFSRGEADQNGDKPPQLGIRGMEKRAVLLGGNLEIRSEPGEGTLVRLELPKKAKEYKNDSIAH